MRLLVGLSILVALAACTSRETHMASDDQTCRSYGFQAGSPDYAKCRMTLDTGRQDRRAAAISAAGDSLGETAASIKPMPPMVSSQPPRAPITCRSTAMGNTVTTNCN